MIIESVLHFHLSWFWPCVWVPGRSRWCLSRTPTLVNVLRRQTRSPFFLMSLISMWLKENSATSCRIYMHSLWSNKPRIWKVSPAEDQVWFCSFSAAAAISRSERSFLSFSPTIFMAHREIQLWKNKEVAESFSCFYLINLPPSVWFRSTVLLVVKNPEAAAAAGCVWIPTDLSPGRNRFFLLEESRNLTYQAL